MSSVQTPLDTFFMQYECPGKYTYSRKKPITKEFQRLRKAYGWKSGQLKRIRRAYQDAIVEQFNSQYRTDARDLNAWKHLSQILGVSPVPDTIGACKKAIGRIHVNLIDLLDTKRTGVQVTVFRSEVELSEYTVATEKFFPKRVAKAGGILKFLLRNIMCPDPKRGSYRG